jgi:hypothetical protein
LKSTEYCKDPQQDDLVYRLLEKAGDIKTHQKKRILCNQKKRKGRTCPTERNNMCEQYGAEQEQEEVN